MQSLEKILKKPVDELADESPENFDKQFLSLGESPDIWSTT